MVATPGRCASACSREDESDGYCSRDTIGEVMPPQWPGVKRAELPVGTGENSRKHDHLASKRSVAMEKVPKRSVPSFRAVPVLCWRLVPHDNTGLLN